MSPKKKLLCVIVLLMKEIISSHSSPSLSSVLKYDITNAVDKWFSKIHDFNATSSMMPLYDALCGTHKLQDFEYDLDHEVEPFQSKFFFHEVVYYIDLEWWHSCEVSNLDWNLQKNTARASLGTCRFHVEGEWRTSKTELYTKFSTQITFKNLILQANTSSVDFFYNEFELGWYYNELPVKWDNFDGNTTNSAYIIHNVTNTNRLIAELEPALIVMLRRIFNRNTELSEKFQKVFDISKQVQSNLTSLHPDIFEKGKKYYYYIPEIPFYCGFTLRAVAIRGVTNIKSLKSYKDHALQLSILIENIRGSMVLDYGRIEEKVLELQFKIDRLLISMERNSECIQIDPPQFRVKSTSGPLTNIQSAVLVHAAIASHSMPSKKICNLGGTHVPKEVELEAKKVSTNWEKVKEICGDWIPFNAKSEKSTPR